MAEDPIESEVDRVSDILKWVLLVVAVVCFAMMGWASVLTYRDAPPIPQAIVDPHGTLVYYEKMEDTQYSSADIAIGKAKAAATYRRPTRVFADVINKGGPATATLPGVFASPGGVPIMVGGKVIGAAGVSGVTGDQDEQCSKAGVAGL